MVKEGREKRKEGEASRNNKEEEGGSSNEKEESRREENKKMIGKEVGKGKEEVGDTSKWPTHSTPYLLVIFSGQAYFQEQLYNSTLLGCSECYTQLVPLHLGHVT